ncbi:MAG: tetratricopeptide repeat protein, partial [Myxococcales bacterium]|nr:tetratricopeptide repeat protein [Myxococcales bacterium]
PESTEVADTVDNLAIIHAATGDRAQAKELYERALAIKEQALGRDRPALAQTLHNLGELAVEEERRAEAVALIERAVAIFDAHDGVQEGEHAARYGLARALVPDDRERAIALARAAAEGYRSAGDGHTDKAEEIEAWAAAHERGGAR